MPTQYITYMWRGREVKRAKLSKKATEAKRRAYQATVAARKAKAREPETKLVKLRRNAQAKPAPGIAEKTRPKANGAGYPALEDSLEFFERAWKAVKAEHGDLWIYRVDEATRNFMIGFMVLLGASKQVIAAMKA